MHNSVPLGHEHSPFTGSVQSEPAGQQTGPHSSVGAGQLHWHEFGSSTKGLSQVISGQGVGVGVGISVAGTLVAVTSPPAPVPVRWLWLGSIRHCPTSPSCGPPNTPESCRANHQIVLAGPCQDQRLPIGKDDPQRNRPAIRLPHHRGGDTAAGREAASIHRSIRSQRDFQHPTVGLPGRRSRRGQRLDRHLTNVIPRPGGRRAIGSPQRRARAPAAQLPCGARAAGQLSNRVLSIA